MNIQYKKKQIRIYLIAGLLWLAITIAQVVFVKNNYWLFTWLVVALFNIGQVIHMYINPYLTINERLLIIKNFMDERSIKLSEITQIKERRGHYAINSGGKMIKINTNIIDPDSLEALNAELKKYNLTWL